MLPGFALAMVRATRILEPTARVKGRLQLQRSKPCILKDDYVLCRTGPRPLRWHAGRVTKLADGDGSPSATHANQAPAHRDATCPVAAASRWDAYIGYPTPCHRSIRFTSPRGQANQSDRRITGVAVGGCAVAAAASLPAVAGGLPAPSADRPPTAAAAAAVAVAALPAAAS